MKTKIITLTIVFAIIIAGKLEAQESDSVKTSPLFDAGGKASLVFNQIAFVNWAKGGENAFSTTSLVNLYANMKKNKLSWENNADLKFGLQNSEQYGLRFNEDLIDLSSKFGYKALEQFYYTFLMNFKSQFAAGYNYPDDSTEVSRFMAPGYLIVSLGMDYQPTDYLSLYISPMTGKFIFVQDEEIANRGSYTNEPAKRDADGAIIQKGAQSLADFGAYLKANFKYEIFENIEIASKLELFNNYTDKNISNRANIDVDLETNINMKVNEFISAGAFFRLLYDHDIKSPIYKMIEGDKTKVGEGPRLQVKESIGISISYTL